ncbi:MAG: radical SAM protein [Candidatus Muiribacteriota bacterium]
MKILVTRIFENSYNKNICLSPPIGILYIVSVLKKEFPLAEIRFYDNVLPDKRKLEYFKKYLKEFKPDFLLTGASYVDRDNVFKWAKTAKKILPEIIVISGGVGSTCSHSEYISKKYIDYVVRGEGEERIVNLLKNIDSKNFMDGICYKIDGKIFSTRPVSFIKNLDSLPMPDWDSFDFKFYSRLPGAVTVVKKLPYAYVMTSRGCPFNCKFCHNSFGSIIRTRSAQNIVNEIKFLKEKGINTIYFGDDIFNLQKEKAKEICREIIKQNLNIHIGFTGIRVDVIDIELFELMKKAGGYFLEFGIQHVVPELNDSGNRKINRKKYIENVKFLKKMGFITQSQFIFGFPGEKLEHSKKNLKFALELDADFSSFFKLIPFPETWYGNNYFNIDELKKIPSHKFNFFSSDKNLHMAEIDFDKLTSFIDYAFFRFYMRPQKIYSLLKRLPYTWCNIKQMILKFIILVFPEKLVFYFLKYFF